MIRTLTLGTALALGCATTAFAQTNTGPDELALTIYNGGTALVADSRTIRLRSGEQVVELPGVSSQILPTSATFLADGLTIAEQNFDFDLLSPEKLMEKAVGEYVEVVRTNPGNGKVTRERAKVLSVNNGVVVEIDGRIEVLRDDDIPTRVVFPDVPSNLRARPTLSILVDADRAGSKRAKLSYLTRGLDWSADYVAVFDEAAGTIDLQGWATLTNNTETTFEDADVAVVAGQVAGATQYDRYGNVIRRPQPRFRGGLESAGTQGTDVERVGDFYLYPLPGDITVRARQTKQVGIVDGESLRAGKSYRFETTGFPNSTVPVSADVRIDFANPGVALPAGTLRVYTDDSTGRSQFVGENSLGHTPAGSRLSIETGKAFDVRVQPTITSDNRVGKNVRDVEVRYRVTNASPRPVEVRVAQNFFANSSVEYEVLDESIDHDLESAYRYVWTVPVPAEGETTLTVSMRETQRNR